MINYNGKIIPASNLQLNNDNRVFKYGDGIFETIKVQNNKVVFFEDHYFRLMASMRMLRMEIPMKFTLEFLEEEILRTVKEQQKTNIYRVRLTIYRKNGGFYTPKTNEVDYVIEVKEGTYRTKSTYKIDLYKDFYNYSGLLSTVKTTNRMLNVIASVFAKENDLDNCILLNERKGVVEVTNGNIFLISGNVVITPKLSEGCIKGVIRKKVIEQLEKSEYYSVEEAVISLFDIQKADEVFITNAIIGIQPVTQYRKKIFATTITEKFIKTLKVLTLA